MGRRILSPTFQQADNGKIPARPVTRKPATHAGAARQKVKVQITVMMIITVKSMTGEDGTLWEDSEVVAPGARTMVIRQLTKAPATRPLSRKTMTPNRIHATVRIMRLL